MWSGGGAYPGSGTQTTNGYDSDTQFQIESEGWDVSVTANAWSGYVEAVAVEDPPAEGEVTVTAFTGAALEELQRNTYVTALASLVVSLLLSGVLVAVGLRR